VCRNPLRVSRILLRRALLARLGLLAWRGGRGLQGEGAPWREVHRGPEGAARALRQLEAVQLDPVAVIERNHHLVLWNRVGGYARVHLEALYHQRSLFEYWAQERCLLPLEDYPVFAARRRPLAVGDPQLRAAVALVRARLASKGPLPARALDSGGRVEGAWGSSRKATSHALEMLWDAREVVVAFRQGEERYFALAEHWLPRELLGQAADESARVRKYLRAYGVVDLQDPRFGWRRMPAAERRDLVARLLQEGELIPLEVQGTRRRYGSTPAFSPSWRAWRGPRSSLRSSCSLPWITCSGGGSGCATSSAWTIVGSCTSRRLGAATVPTRSLSWRATASSPCWTPGLTGRRGCWLWSGYSG